MKLSHRLETVASFVSKGSNIADIGTDHGYIPIYLAEQGTVGTIIAMDVRTGPLERAKSHIESCHLADRIETRQSDGLKNLKPQEADTVIIAGMGGELVIHILDDGKHMWDCVREWILSPQSELEKVRKYLETNGFFIDRETMTVDAGKYYTVMRVKRGVMDYQKESYYRYGKLLVEEKNPVLAEFLMYEKDQTLEVLSHVGQANTNAAKERMIELEQKLSVIKEAQDEMQ